MGVKKAAKWTWEEYLVNFHQIKGHDLSDSQAFGRTEKLHYKIFGCNKYKSYDSFRQVKWKLLKKQRIKLQSEAAKNV